MTLRNLARIGVSSVLAVGALGLGATPALAADVDLGLEAKDVTIAAGTDEKAVTFAVTNNGTTKPEDAKIVYDITGLDAKKVKPSGDGEDCTGTDGLVATCDLKGAVPAPGASADLVIPLQTLAGAKGEAGTIKITLKVAGDTVKANDTKTVKVTIGDNGVDLLVQAEDVTEVDDEAESTGKAVPPGTVAPLFAFVINQGDMTAAGLKYEVKLPKQTTFAQPVENCVQAADKRSLTCTADDVTLLPISKVTDPGNFEGFVFATFFPVLVAADAKGPVSLKGGVVTATAIEQKPFVARRSRAAEPLPEWAARMAAAEVAKLDVDTADNSDDFAVLVAGPTAGNGGGSDGDNGGNGGGGDDGDGGLPRTGPAGLAIGGTGLAVLVGGLVLFFAARRRRVVLVTPGDEK